MHLPRPTINQKEAIIKTYDLSNKAKCLIYTNQTGKFPKKLSRGYQYIMVLIEIDSNAILVEAMKICLAGEMIRAYQILVERLRNAELTPKMHILDNECFAKFKEQIKLNNMKYQLVTPHDHRRNISEKAIQVFKAHFISILCGVDKSFPLHLWDRLLGNAWEHYRCHEIYICDTKHTRMCLTAFFKLKYLTMPTITPADALIRAADYLTDAILGLVPTPMGMQDAVGQLMVIFKQQACATRDAATAQRVLRERPS
jgi:hypothetical protein